MFKHPTGMGASDPHRDLSFVLLASFAALSMKASSWWLCKSAGGRAKALSLLESCGSAAAPCAQHVRAESPLPLFIFAEAVCKTSTAGKEPIVTNTVPNQEKGMIAGAGV